MSSRRIRSGRRSSSSAVNPIVDVFLIRICYRNVILEMQEEERVKR